MSKAKRLKFRRGREPLSEEASGGDNTEQRDVEACRFKEMAMLNNRQQAVVHHYARHEACQ
jgi:hypothetical protein